MKSSIKLGLFILGLLFTIILVSRFLNLKPKTFQISAVDFSSNWSFNFLEQSVDKELEKIVKKNLAGSEGEFAVAIKSLNPKKENYFYSRAEEVFPAGSLYKLYLLTATFAEIEQGKLKLDQEISANKEHLTQVLGSEEFGYEDHEGDRVGYKVSEALERISAISDNYAAVTLAEKIGWEKVREQARKIEANSTTIKNPISTTASDTALFLEKLYEQSSFSSKDKRADWISRESADKIIELLSNSRLNNRIPALLPKAVKVAHKTGELSRVRHDAGIVFLTTDEDEEAASQSASLTETKAYLIVLMSKDLKYEDDGIEILARISKDVYEYYTSNSVEKKVK